MRVRASAPITKKHAEEGSKKRLEKGLTQVDHSPYLGEFRVVLEENFNQKGSLSTCYLIEDGVEPRPK